jgi:hypothetical protein
MDVFSCASVIVFIGSSFPFAVADSEPEVLGACATAEASGAVDGSVVVAGAADEVLAGGISLVRPHPLMASANTIAGTMAAAFRVRPFMVFSKREVGASTLSGTPAADHSPIPV